ncbi:hypothetical protein GOODEAATRI_000097, partial [Goodea atripinnis]
HNSIQAGPLWPVNVVLSPHSGSYVYASSLWPPHTSSTARPLGLLVYPLCLAPPVPQNSMPGRALGAETQPAASHAHGGRWSCKWRLYVCANAAPAEKGTNRHGPGRQRSPSAATLGQCTDLAFRLNAEDRAVLLWFVVLSIALVAMRKWILHTRFKRRPVGEE